MSEPAARRALRRVMAALVRIYFREVEVIGEVPAAATGGRLFAANHVNALVDPVVVIASAPCPMSTVAKATLWQVPGLGPLLDLAGAVPIVRRVDAPAKAGDADDAVFSRVAQHLATEGNILIFPEGTSHNEPARVALRSGAGRMLARAQADGAVGLTVQAIALEFDARDQFRSRALVVFGPPRAVDALVAAHGADGLAARITELLAWDLDDLLVQAPSWDLRLAIARVAELYAHERDDGQEDTSLEERHRLGLQVKQAGALLAAAAPAALAEVQDEVAGYFRELEGHGVTDAMVRGGTAASPRFGRALAMLVTAPLALIGLALYGLPYPLPRLITRRLGPDVDAVSTYKLGFALLVYPLWIALVTVAALVALPRPCALGTIGLLLASPFAVLPWLDRGPRLRAKLRALAPRGRDASLRLQRRRAALLRRLEDLRARVPLG